MRQLTSFVVLFFLVLTVITSCRYQPSSPARTEVPLFVPPTRSIPAVEPTNSMAPEAILSTEVKPASTPTVEVTMEQDCPVSTDPDYGFSPDDPVQVGSNQLSDGPERELVYLLTLRGPEGEEVFYTRQSPQFNQAGTIVDPYLVEYEGLKEPLTLYFDLYTYAPLFVPLGFTCEAPFPIQPPQE